MTYLRRVFANSISQIVCIFSHISPPIVASSFVGSTTISARTFTHPSPLKHADERRRYVPIARAISKFCHGEGATLVRIARRDRIHSRRVEPAPRGPPATSVGFRLIDELRAHQCGPPGPVPARCTRTRSCVRPARCTRTSSERIRASRPSARCRRDPARPASPGRSSTSHRLGFEEPRCFFQGLRDPRDHPGSPSSAIGASREVSAACNTYHRPVRALESS